MTWTWCILGAYLVGSIPFGLMIGKFRGIDIREHGSKNIGATNVHRVLGSGFGLLCLALDVAKGVGPVVVAGVLGGVIGRPANDLKNADVLATSEMWLWLAVALATVLGHVFPLYLRLRGGKGVATGFGALAAMWPLLSLPALTALVVWYFSMRVTKYVAVASMAAALSLPLSYVISMIPSDGVDVMPSLIHAAPPLIFTVVLALLVVFRHRGNISRLRRGEEPRVGDAPRRGEELEP